MHKLFCLVCRKKALLNSRKGNKALNDDQWKQSKKGKQTYLREALPGKANYYFHPLNNFISHSITGLIYFTKQSTSLWYIVQKYLYPMKKRPQKGFIKVDSCPLVSNLLHSQCISDTELEKLEQNTQWANKNISKWCRLNEQRMRKRSRNTENSILVHLCGYMQITCAYYYVRIQQPRHSKYPPVGIRNL